MANKLTQAFYCLLVVGLSGCERAVEAAENASARTIAAARQWQDPVHVAVGPAQVGPWRMNDSEFHYVDDGTASLGADGELVVAWTDNQQQDIYLQRYDKHNDQQLRVPVNVSRSPEVFSWLPKVQLVDEERVYVLWQEIIFSGGSHGGEIYFARSLNGGKDFEQPINLSQTENGAGKGRLSEERWDNGSYDLAVAANGDIYLAWTEYQGALRFARSTDGGESFSDPRYIAGSDQLPARAPTLAVGQGTIYLAWTVGETANADIHLTRSMDAGSTFEPAQVIHESGGHSDVPSLALDSNNRLHLVYSEAQARRSKILYVQLDAEGEALAQPQRISSAGSSAHAPTIVTAADRQLLVIWEPLSDDGRLPRGLSFSASVDSGESFSRPQIVPGSKGPKGAFNGSLQGDLGQKIAANGQGAFVVTNSQLRRGEESQVLFIRADMTAP